ncbi:MAG TPA: ATP-dependent DNA helicase PcrA, partial [Clostridium sp.]|nr:ATP-dependent DNA helicase PcrA [Clostridium sp.]
LNRSSDLSGFYNSKKPMASSEISGMECGVDKCAVKEELTIGVKVRHGKFGVGTVVSISSDNGETIVTIAFNNMGIKKLMLNKAGLELA